MHTAFPFTALVGQEPLKRALVLCAIQPRLGGVLIRGTKGIAKSTAVRALASLLPPIDTVAGCPFQRSPGEDVPGWPLPPDAPVLTRPAPLVELPLGATEDRVLGSLHLEKALRGERTFEPGLLAAANRGILYIDEVNLLPDHLVDILLDAAASGWHRLERDGLSLGHPARFVLVGTMNPEEGELRPQLLDRFGLAVDATDLTDPIQRAAAVERRLAYEDNPNGFLSVWQEAERMEKERIAAAQRRLPHVQVPPAVLVAVSERCVAEGVEGLRADLTLTQAACAWAAYLGKTAVGSEEIEAVADLALAHRRKPRPPTPPGSRSGPPPNGDNASKSGQEQRPESRPSSSAKAELRVFESAGLFAAQVRPPLASSSEAASRGNKPTWLRLGAASGTVRASGFSSGALAWSATIRAAAPFQRDRGRVEAGGVLRLAPEDVRVRPRRQARGRLLFFVVDTSGSMAAWQRMRQTKAAILALLFQAYRCRDRVCLLTFRGDGCEWVLRPCRGFATARSALEKLPVGGTTPLARGLAEAGRFIVTHRRRHPGEPIWTVLLTDGRCNVSTVSEIEPWPDAVKHARLLAMAESDFTVVDTETGWPRLGQAVQLADALNAQCLALEEVLGKPLPDRFRRAV